MWKLLQKIINSLFRKNKKKSSTSENITKHVVMKPSDEQSSALQDTMQLDVSEAVQICVKEELEDTVRLPVIDNASVALEDTAQEQQDFSELSQELFEEIMHDSEKTTEENEDGFESEVAEVQDIEESSNAIDEKNNEEKNTDIDSNNDVTSNDISAEITEYEFADFQMDDEKKIIDHLLHKIETGHLLGIDILAIAENKEMVQRIHEYAQDVLAENYKRSVITYVHKGDVILSLVLIALEYYDGNFWDYVHEKYSELYRGRSQQKIDAMIRKIIGSFNSDDNNARLINYIIRHTIVPKQFISDFIVFAYDIYKDVLKYDISDNIAHILAEVYLNVGENFDAFVNSKKTHQGVKTYRLITTTKELISNPDYFGELIGYTRIILSYIHTYYWNESVDDLRYPEYFKPIFDTWKSEHPDFFRLGKKHRKHERTIWNAEISLSGKQICLDIPEFLVMDIMDPHDVSIVVMNDKNILKKIENPSIREVFAGYQIDSLKVLIEDPVGKLSYQILENDKVLFDSRDSLFREFILFDDKGKELKKTEGYSGDLYIVAKDISSPQSIDIVGHQEEYELGFLIVKPYDAIQINQKTITFYDRLTVKVEGTIYDDVIIRHGGKEYNLYKNVESIMFCTEVKEEDLVLQTGNEHYKISNNTVYDYGKEVLYRVDLIGKVHEGVNVVKVLNRQDHSVIERFILFVDSEYHCTMMLSNSNGITAQISSSLAGNCEVYADMIQDNPISVSFENPIFEGELWLIPSLQIPVYRIDQNPWRLFDDNISIKEMTVYSHITVNGIVFDSVKLATLDNEVAFSLDVQKAKGTQVLTTEKLKAYDSGEHPYAILMFYNSNVPVGRIYVYYHAEFIENSLVTHFDPQSKTLSLSFSYAGDDIVTFELLDDQSQCVHSEEAIPSPCHLSVPDIHVFRYYTIIIYGGEDSLFSEGTGKYVMYRTQPFVFYSLDEIEGNVFDVKKVVCEHYSKYWNRFLEQERKVLNTELHITDHENEDVYLGYLTNGEIFSCPVRIEVTTEVSDGAFICCLNDMSGDQFLFDKYKKTIYFEEPDNIKDEYPCDRFLVIWKRKEFS